MISGVNMTKVKFFICKHCGNLVGIIQDSGVPIVCCGENMTELVPNTTDGALEKHVPVVTKEKTKEGFDIIKAKVGSIEHPMTEAHYIQWIYLQTDKGGHRISLNPGEKPEVSFILHNETPIAVYEYCNLHGLWKADI